jgi:molecular chaperone DnaK
MGKIIGIDLGSTNSCVAVVENGTPTVIVNSEGNRTTPSVVGYSKDGERKVGEPAKRQAVTNSKNTVEVIKRFIGNSYKDCKDYTNKFAYSITEGTNGLAVVDIDDKQYTPQEISAAILQKMKQTAEDYLGSEVTDAVITVPAYFNDAQRKATKEAGEIAGLNVKRIINEPTAASLAFGVDKSDKALKIMVFDFGGGTMDVSILDMADGVFEVLGTNGDTFLGGKDIDNTIVDLIVEEGKKDFGVDLSKDPMALQRIKEAAEKAKIELSNVTSTEINLPYITATQDGPKHINYTLSRAKFESMISGIVDKTITLAKDCLSAANINASELDEILLVGGSTRIPLVQEKLKDTFGKEPNKGVNPDEAVALGAAIQGSVLAGEQDGIVLLDVTPLNLAIETLGGVATPLIEANTTIPCKKSQTFSTAVDNQTSVTVHVTQGNRSMADDNKSLGTFNLDGIAPAPKGIPQIEVVFDIDSNGILAVTAKDKATGKEQSIRIEGSSGLSKDEVEKMRAEAEANADADKAKAERIQKLNVIESTIYQIENSLKEFDEKLTDEQKSSVNAALDNLKALYNVKDEDRDMEALEKASEELMKVWYPIVTEINKATKNSSEESATTEETKTES